MYIIKITGFVTYDLGEILAETLKDGRSFWALCK